MLTLVELVSYVKFLSRERESSEFACSQIVAEILGELNAQAGIPTPRYVDVDTPMGRTIINALEWHLSQTSDWDKLSADEKIKHAENIVSPYLLDPHVIRDIISKKDSSV